jgi:hypothetical protein
MRREDAGEHGRHRARSIGERGVQLHREDDRRSPHPPSVHRFVTETSRKGVAGGRAGIAAAMLPRHHRHAMLPRHHRRVVMLPRHHCHVIMLPRHHRHVVIRKVRL